MTIAGARTVLGGLSTTRPRSAEPKGAATSAGPRSRAQTAAAVEKLAQSDPAFAVEPDRFDKDGWLLGTPAGVVDLRTGELRKAKPQDYLSKLTAVAPGAGVFEAERDCPRWLTFLREATDGNVQLVEALQRWFGYTLTGDVREEQLVFIHGPGGSGKSTLVNTIGELLGDYCINIPVETLTESRFERHPTEIARLHGARMAWGSETEQGRRWNQKRLTELTGGDTITARFMRNDFFSFKPQFKLTIVGNNQPSLRNVDAAVRRRFAVVPFRHQPKRADETLKAQLRAEMPGILSWLIEGCLAWQKHGLNWPKVVADYTQDYLAEQDAFQKWLDECCELKAGYSETALRLWASWSQFAHRHDEDPGSKKQTFPDQLRARNFTGLNHVGPDRSRGWKGVRLRPEQDGNELI